MNETAERIQRLLPLGRENAMSREAVAAALGVSDRKARKMIEAAKRQGVFICNDQTGDGYYITLNEKDLLRQYRQDTARAMSILSRRKPLRDYLKERGYEV